MTLEAKATIYKHTKGSTLYVTIPSKMASDSQFDFKNHDKVLLKVEGKKIVVEHYKA